MPSLATGWSFKLSPFVGVNAFFTEIRNETVEPFHSIPLHFHAIYLDSLHNPLVALANLVKLKDYNITTF